MLENLNCIECKNACLSEFAGAHPDALQLTFEKTRGGLCIPSKDVTDICLKTDEILEKYNNVYDLRKLNIKRLQITVMNELDMNRIFPYLLESHEFTGFSDENHVSLLIKFIIQVFVKIKKSYAVRSFNEMRNDNLRQRLSRFLISSGR